MGPGLGAGIPDERAAILNVPGEVAALIALNDEEEHTFDEIGQVGPTAQPAGVYGGVTWCPWLTGFGLVWPW